MAINLTDAQFKFRVVNHVTLPILKFEGKPLFVRFDDKIFKGKIVEEKKEAPDMARVTNLLTGEPHHLILGKVLLENLIDKYPEDSYVGKCFHLNQTAPEGKRYKLYDITEIEVEESAPAATSTAAPAASTPAARPGKSTAPKDDVPA